MFNVKQEKSISPYAAATLSHKHPDLMIMVFSLAP